jgi:hypothetical protein
MKYLALPSLLTACLLQSALAGGFGPGPWANGAYYPGQLDGRYSANVYNNTQDRLDFSEMDTPSGNIVRTDTFETTSGTTNFSSYLTTNGTTTITITNDAGVITSSNAVYTTNIVSTTVTNTTPGTTNLVTSGAAAVVSGVLGFGISGGSPSVSSNGTTVTTIGTGAGIIDLDSSENYFVIYVDGDAYAGRTAAGINLHTQRVAGSLVNGVGASYNFILPTVTANTNGTSTTNYTTTSVPVSAASGYFNAKIKSDKSPFIFKGAGEISVNEALANLGISPGGHMTYPFNLDGIKVSDN